jgi:hypothetical protein
MKSEVRKKIVTRFLLDQNPPGLLLRLISAVLDQTGGDYNFTEDFLQGNCPGPYRLSCSELPAPKS